MFIKILPLDTIPRNGLALMSSSASFTWCLRRPLSAPIVLIGLLFLYKTFCSNARLASMRRVQPCVRMVQTAGLRAKDFPFVAEWLTASIAIVAVFVLSQGIASLSLIATPPAVMFVKELMPTILAYPVVVLLLRYGLGLRRQQMAGFDASLGQEH